MALESVNRSIPTLDCPSFYYMGLEVRSRVEIALGHVVAAEEILDEIENAGIHYGSDLADKCLLGRARIHTARKEFDQALTLFEAASADSFSRMNLHYHNQADEERVRILIAPRQT